MKESPHSSKSKPIILVIHINDGVTYYRHASPIKYLKRLGWKFLNDDFTFTQKWKGFTEEEGVTKEDFDKMCKQADMLLVQRNDMPMYIVESSLCQSLYNIPMVYDTDDNVHAIRPSNIGYKSYNPISPHTKFAITALQEAFAITTSTRELKEVYGQNNKRITILPNAIDFEVWDKCPRGKKPKGEIRLSLLLSGSHYEDIKEIEPVLIEIMVRYPNVKLYVMNSYKDDILQKLPRANRKQLIWQDWCELNDWPRMNKKLAFDIGLAPLNDTDFGRSKSNLRWMEYAAQGIPIIASDTLPYQNTESILCNSKSEWFDALVDLIEHPDKREELGKKAYDKCKQEFNMADIVKLYDKTYSDIIKEYRSIYGEPNRIHPLVGVTTQHINSIVTNRHDQIRKDNIRGETHRSDRKNTSE